VRFKVNSAIEQERTHRQGQRSSWRWIIAVQLAAGVLCFSGVGISPAIAQEEQFPPNPLEMTEPDPLLPRLVVDRPLSPQEQSVLSAAVDQLQRQAETEFSAGNVPEAFEIWNRVLRLRRVLGTEQEVDSLSLVGEVAWRENQTTEVRVITERLQQIQQEAQAQAPVNFDLLLKIAQAYQKLRAIDPALSAYSQILAQAQQQQNIPRQEETLQAMGDLHLAWFDYSSAAVTYQQLVVLARSQRDQPAQIEYMKQLAYVYQQGNQPEPAIAVQQQLVDLYARQQQYLEIPPLKLAIADSYIALNRPDLAATNYQEAYAVSRSTQQYGYGSEALQKLADLYRSIDRPDDALVVYQLLIDVQQQSYNSYGMMETYSQIGQLQQARGNTTQALAAFRRGLELAQQLNYKVGYFTAQIQQLSQL
jgi:tetratricopeptide (TPR) repeat protein